MPPDYSKPISDDLKRMLKEDEGRSSMKSNMEAIVSRAKLVGQGADSYPELEELITKTSIDFSNKLVLESGKYGSNGDFDVYMELYTDFAFDILDMMKEWAEKLAPRTEFERGCYCTLKWITSMLDKIEELRPKEPQ